MLHTILKRSVTAGAIAALLSASTLLAESKNYNLDNVHTHVGFKVKHLLVTNVRGNFKEYTGKIAYDDKTKRFTVLEATIDAASINTENEKRDKHLRSRDFFEVETYPEITFKLKEHTQEDELVGLLTIKGVTKEVEFDVDVNGPVQDNWGGTRVGFSLEGKINREDFNIVWDDTLDGGGLVVGDIVRIEIDAQGKIPKPQ